MFNDFLRYLYRVYRYYFKHKKSEIKNFCEVHFGDKKDGQKEWIEKDMKHWYLVKNISPTQYWEQSFDMITKSAKRGMLPKSELYRFDEKYNPKEDIHMVGNKYECYERFKEYYGRECILVNNPAAIGNDFEDYCARIKKFIIKPLFKDSGVGVEVFSHGESEVPDYPFIAEEIIKQSDALAKFHPQSVNTLRLNTIRCKDEVVVWQCILRYGRGGNVVDNAHFGGCFSVIDDNGYAVAAGDVERHTFTVHPDTGVPLTGFKVPDWEKACKLVRHLATKVGGLRYIGWDLAHTDNGWILVEANTSPGILSPMVTGKGVAKEFYDIKRRM
jgi:hypothetical protein